MDLTSVEQDLRGLEDSFELTFHAGSGESGLASALSEVAEAIRHAVGGRFAVAAGDGAGLPATPGLTVSARGKGKINYLALPEGREAPPFLEALGQLARPLAGATAELEERLASLDTSAELLVFIASTCPHCPQAVRAANSVAAASPLVTTSIIDAQRYEQLAQRFSVQSVPLTILDRRFFITGVVLPAELAETILARGSEEYESRLFRALLEQARLDEATALLGEGSAGRHFVPAWRDSTTSSRMGLLLVAERLLEDEPASLDAIVADLLPLLRIEDVALRGDTADLLGRIGSPAAEADLARLLEDPNPDVAEAASDALEQLRERS